MDLFFNMIRKICKAVLIRIWQFESKSDYATIS